MKAVDPSRKKKMWNDNIETKCVAQLNENFPYDETPVQKGIIFEEQINDTPNFTREQKREFCKQVYLRLIPELPEFAKQLAKLAEEQDK